MLSCVQKRLRKMFRQAFELGQPDLGQAPEAFDAVDMDGAFGELVAGMVGAGIGCAPGPEAGEWPSPWSRVTS